MDGDSMTNQDRAKLVHLLLMWRNECLQCSQGRLVLWMGETPVHTDIEPCPVPREVHHMLDLLDRMETTL
jgi:hypothetical protein